MKDILFGNKPYKVKIEHLNKEIYIRELSYTALMSMQETQDYIEKSFIALIDGVCDEQGKRVFTQDDVPEIANNMSWYAIQEIAGKIAEITTATDNDLVK